MKARETGRQSNSYDHMLKSRERQIVLRRKPRFQAKVLIGLHLVQVFPGFGFERSVYMGLQICVDIQFLEEGNFQTIH